VEPPARTLRRLLPVFALALGLALTVSACGSGENELRHPEGIAVDLDGIVYQVQLSRTLNPGDEADQSLLRDQPDLQPGKEWLGVFLTIQNETDEPYTPPSDMVVVDTQGNRYPQVPAPGAGQLGLDFDHPIRPHGSAPFRNSLALTSSTGGALVLFEITDEAVQNRPLILEIPSPNGKEKARIVLDI
jgi:hypothetical protein